jgi:hypothetical protein
MRRSALWLIGRKRAKGACVAFFDGGGQCGSALEALVETTLQLRMHRR